MTTNKEHHFVSAVVYLHNNDSQIEKFFNNLYNLLSNHFDKFEIIFVNDSCHDQTIQTVKKMAINYSDAIIRIINMSIYQGIELSMIAGVDLAIGDFVFEFDSVLMDYEPELILKVFQHLSKGFDIVSAAPKRKNYLSSRLFYALFKSLSQKRYNLRTERFRVLSRRAINRIQRLSKMISYRKAAYVNSGLGMDHILYDPLFSIKEKDTSRNFKQIRQKSAMDTLIVFTDVAFRISLSITLLLIAFTLIALAYTVIVYLGENKPVEGWTTLMLIISGGFSGIFLIFAIIIKYLSIIVELILQKQKYLVESVEKL